MGRLRGLVRISRGRCEWTCGVGASLATKEMRRWELLSPVGCTGPRENAPLRSAQNVSRRQLIQMVYVYLSGKKSRTRSRGRRGTQQWKSYESFTTCRPYYRSVSYTCTGTVDGNVTHSVFLKTELQNEHTYFFHEALEPSPPPLVFPPKKIGVLTYLVEESSSSNTKEYEQLGLYSKALLQTRKTTCGLRRSGK